MTSLLISLVGVLLSTNNPAPTNLDITLRADHTSRPANPNDPAEKQLDQIMDQDDQAQAEVDKWIQENMAFEAQGSGLPKDEMRRKIQARLAPVDQAYQDFLQHYPTNTRARVAYASFLGDTKSEDAAEEQLDKALASDTNNPAVYNNLANIYGHHGPVKKAFEYYAKAIQINPQEAVYYHNLGTTVFLFRKDAQEYYGIDEQQVFNKAFALYSNAMRLEPTDFPLASDVAQTYYGVHPFRPEPALKAWTNALSLAHDEIEREGVYVHFARVNIMSKRFDEARKFLTLVTNQMYMDLKNRVSKNLEERQKTAETEKAASGDKTVPVEKATSPDKPLSAEK